MKQELNMGMSMVEKMTEEERIEYVDLKESIGPLPVRIEFSGNDDETNRLNSKMEEFAALPQEEQAIKKARYEELHKKFHKNDTKWDEI